MRIFQQEFNSYFQSAAILLRTEASSVVRKETFGTNILQLHHGLTILAKPGHQAGHFLLSSNWLILISETYWQEKVAQQKSCWCCFYIFGVLSNIGWGNSADWSINFNLEKLIPDGKFYWLNQKQIKFAPGKWSKFHSHFSSAVFLDWDQYFQYSIFSLPFLSWIFSFYGPCQENVLIRSPITNGAFLWRTAGVQEFL